MVIQLEQVGLEHLSAPRYPRLLVQWNIAQADPESAGELRKSVQITTHIGMEGVAIKIP